MRERFFALTPDAMTTVEYALQMQKDASIGLRILRATGVAAHRERYSRCRRRLQRMAIVGKL